MNDGVDVDPSTDPSRGALAWRRSFACNGNACVEVAFVDGGTVMLRDSKDPDGPVLSFDTDEWSAFVAGVRSGELATP